MSDSAPSAAPDAWHRLLHGDLAALPRIDGKLDLRGVVVAPPRSRPLPSTAIGRIETRTGLTELRGARWRGVQFAGSVLSELLFFDCVIEDCVFDDCTCRGWRMWNTIVARSSS